MNTQFNSTLPYKKRFLKSYVRSVAVVCSLFNVALFSASAFGAVTAPVTDGLKFQLDASTLNLTNEASVEYWDTSDGKYTFSQNEANYKPVYHSSVNSLNGKAAVWFDGDYMRYDDTFGISGNSDRTIFVVWADAVNTTANYQHVLHMGNADTGQAYGFSVNRGEGGNIVGNHYWGSGFNGSYKGSNAGNIGAITYDGTYDSVLVNGHYSGMNTKTDVNTNGSGVTLIGSRLNPSAEGIRGYIAEILVYDRELTTSEWNQTNDYLFQKYGITNQAEVARLTTDWDASQVKIDFDANAPSADTWGTYITDGCGIIDDGGNNIFRLLNKTENLNNQAYNSAVNSATGGISGKFDLRLTDAVADGVSFVLAGSNVDVTQQLTSPNGESGAYAGSFGLGYEIYNKNNLGIYWDGAKVGTLNVGSTFNMKSGEWFTTEFDIDYRGSGLGADVSVSLFSVDTGALIGSWEGYLSNLNSFDSSLLLRGRTGGSTAIADFDNIYVNYSNAMDVEYIWKTDATGDFNTATNWDGDVAPPAEAIMKIVDGTNSINSSSFAVNNGQSLLISGGTTTGKGSNDGSNIAAGSVVKIAGDATVTYEGNIRIGDGTYNNATTGMMIIDENANVTAKRWLAIGRNYAGDFLMQGGTLTLTDGGRGIILGDTDNTKANMTVSGGIITNAGKLLVAHTDGSTGTYTQTGGKYKGTNVVVVGEGQNTTATFTQSGGEFIAKEAVTVGRSDGTSKATLNHTGGTFRALNGLTINSGATATLGNGAVISDNETFGASGDSILVGAGSSSATNKITIEKGGTLNASTSLRIGVNDGDYGEVVVKGTLNANGRYIFLGNSGDGKITVDGGVMNGTEMIMGEKGTGSRNSTFEVLNGGVAKFTGDFSAGDKPGAMGTVTLAGNGSELRVSGAHFYIGGNEGNKTATGTLTQTGASYLGTKLLEINSTSSSDDSFINISADSYVLLSTDAPTVAFDDTFRSSYNAGTIYVEDGGALNLTTGSIVAPQLVSSGTATLALNTKGNFQSMYIDSGTADKPAVINGTVVVDENLTVAHGSDFVIGYRTNNANNKVTVGPNGYVTSNKSLNMGYEAGSYGELLVQGTYKSTGTYALIGYRGEGKVIVDGGSFIAKDTILGDNTGGNCVGTIEVKNNGSAKLDRLAIGDKNTATGTVTVTNGTLTVDGDTLVGNNGKGTLTITDSNATLKLMYVGNSTDEKAVGSVTVSGNSTVTSGNVRVGSNGTGSFVLEGNSTWSANGEFMVAHESGANDCSLIIRDNATLNITGNHFIVGRSAKATALLADNGTINYGASGVCGVGEVGGDGAVFNMTGGTFNVNTMPKSQGGYYLNHNAIQNQSGGNMNIGTTSTAVDLRIDSGAYNLTGGTLNIYGTVKGADKLHVTENGVLSANNINSSFTLEGGFLSPGPKNTIGTTTVAGDLTMLDGSTLLLQIDGATNSADKIDVNGMFNFNEGSQIMLEYDLANLSAGMSFDLIEFDTSSVSLESITGALSLADNYYWTVAMTGNTINFSIDGNAIPEPTTWTLMLLGMFGCAVYRFRSRKVA